MRHVTVVANCHCLPIARTLSLIGEDIDVDFIDVNLLEHEAFKKKAEDLFVDDGHRIVLSFQFRESWESLSTERLRGIYGPRLVTFTNIHFNGLHPDITYVGSMGQRFTGVLRDYHSKLVLYSFASGRSAVECTNLFNAKTYERLGFLDLLASSSQELSWRDKDLDVKFAPDFFDILKQELPLFTVNHPTDSVLQALCRRLCDHVGIDYTPFPGAALTNSLSDNCIWPVYDAVAEHHRLPYRTPQRFVVPNRAQSRSLSLGEFVSRSYQGYGEVPTGQFKGGVRALPFHDAFQAALD